MISFAPTEAAFEGFRIVRREPRAAAVWTLLWLGAFVFTAVVVSLGEQVHLTGHGPTAVVSHRDGRLGPFAAVSAVLFLLVWATTTVAVYRAVLRPHDRRYFFLRLGGDELRLAVMTVSSFLLVLVFGAAPAYLLFVLADPLMRAMPALAREIAAVGAVATVCVEIWLGVRLSLISVETVAEKRFHLTAYWPLTRGRFWYLFACYFVCFILFFALTVAYFVVGWFVYWVANPDIGAGDLLRRAGVLALAGVLAVLTAGYWLMFTTIFCACQAFAFREILSEGHSDVVIAPEEPSEAHEGVARAWARGLWGRARPPEIPEAEASPRAGPIGRSGAPVQEPLALRVDLQSDAGGDRISG
jgi:hypothetical protein